MSTSTYADLGIPASSATVSVKAFNVVDEPNTVIVPAGVFLSPVLPQRVMFDLGPREDLTKTAEVIAEAVKAGVVAMPVSRDIGTQLKETGVELDSINAVIWSHAHFDHIGDMHKFPPSVDLVFGDAMVTDLADPKTQLQESDMAGRTLVPLNFASSQLELCGFRSLDFFGDGSLYLLDVPGHLDGHICALARVTPTTFVLLAGDACFHPGLLRPTADLPSLYPYPEGLVARTRASISASHFPTTDSLGEGKFDLTTRTTPLLDIAESGYFEDPPLARAAIRKMEKFDANADVFVVQGHDESLMSVVGALPRTLDGWKASGWKEKHMWAFLEEENPAFRFNVVEAAA
ncbi:beta-lactamase-like protein [Roridomyces roridus]|uniref:Beta-lactamase-like protein n=1 Tax=Roridomyces roridus TaxID=1738132 RepID=A0AAD7FXQ1_9AGAR|nr:beta-lactamase-like protein [Roridomyces roridus]